MDNRKEDEDKLAQHLKDLLNTDSPSFAQDFLIQNEKYITSLI